MSWKLVAHAPKPIVHAALLAHDEAFDWDPDIVLTGSEAAGSRPDRWTLAAYLPRRPTTADRQAFAALFVNAAPEFAEEELPDTDWVVESQQGVEPIRAGRFYVHTPDRPPSDRPGVISLAIPAGQAFGTGQHATTAGCLAMLDAMRRRGVVVRNFADIGTGTGVLAFAALALWPRALATASDIDPITAGVVAANAASNGVAIDARPGALTMIIADGMADPLLVARGPYDLLVANILAGPLIELAENFGAAVAPGGHLVLAGLLETQERSVRRAYIRIGFRLAARAVEGDWSILWLRRRMHSPRLAEQASRSGQASTGSGRAGMRIAPTVQTRSC